MSHIQKLSFIDFDSGALLSLDLRQYLKELRNIQDLSSQSSDRQFSAIMRRYSYIQDKSILSLSHHFDDFSELRVALRPYFAHWQNTYILLIKYFQYHGYSFKTMDEFSESDVNQKICFIRYDIHCRDLPGLYGYLDVNKALNLPSNAYVFWRYAEQEEAYSEHFLALNKFAANCDCKLGYHTSPVDSYLIWSKFNGSEKEQVKWLRSSQGALFFEKLMNDKDFLSDLIDKATQHFLSGAEDFRNNFDNPIGIASHGGALGYFLRTNYGVLPAQIGKVPERADADRVWSAVAARPFLSSAPIEESGLKYDSDIMPYKHGFCPISDSIRDVDLYLNECEKAISQHSAVELLCHPATLASNRGHGDLFSALCRKMNISEAQPVYQKGVSVGCSNLDKSFQSEIFSEETLTEREQKNIEFISLNGKNYIKIFFRDSSYGMRNIIQKVSKLNNPNKRNVRGKFISYNFIPGRAYKCSIERLKIEGNINIKVWIFLYDVNDVKSTQLIRNIFSPDDDLVLEFCAHQLAEKFEVFIEFWGAGEAYLSNKIVIEELEFPYFKI